MKVNLLSEVTFAQLVEQKQMIVGFNNTYGHVAWIGFAPSDSDDLIKPDKTKVPLAEVTNEIMIEIRCQIGEWIKSQGLDNNGGSSGGSATGESYAHEGITDYGSIQIYTMPKYSFIVRNDHLIKDTAITVVSHALTDLDNTDEIKGIEEVLTAKGDMRVNELLCERSADMQIEWAYEGCNHSSLGIGYHQDVNLPKNLEPNMLLLGSDCAIDLYDYPAIAVHTSRFMCCILGTKVVQFLSTLDRNFGQQNGMVDAFTATTELFLGEGKVTKLDVDFEHFRYLFNITEGEIGASMKEGVEAEFIELVRVIARGLE